MVIVEGERFAGAVTARVPRRGASAPPRRRPPSSASANRSPAPSRRPVAGAAVADCQPSGTAAASDPAAGGTPPIGLVARPVLGAASGSRRALRLRPAAPLAAAPADRRPADLGRRPRAVGRFLEHRRSAGQGRRRRHRDGRPGRVPRGRHAQDRRPAGRLQRQPAQAAGRRRRRLDGRHRPRRHRRPPERLRHRRRAPASRWPSACSPRPRRSTSTGSRSPAPATPRVDLRAGAQVTLSNSLIRDNEGARRHRPGPGGTAPRAQRHHPQRPWTPAARGRRGRAGRGARARGQRHRRQRRRRGAGLAGGHAGGVGAAQRAVASAGTTPAAAPVRPRTGAGRGRHRRPRPRPGRPGPDRVIVDALGRLSPSGAPRRRHEPRLSRHAPARRPRRRRQVGRAGQRRRRPGRTARRRAAAPVPRRRHARPRRPRHPRRRARALHRDGVHRRRGSLDRPARARPLHAQRRGRSLGGARRRARSRPPVRRRRRRRDLPRHRPRRSQAAQHPRLRRPADACASDAPTLASRVRVLDFGVAKGIRGRRRRNAQRLRQRALHVAGAPDRRPRQHDERLLVARRRAVRAARRRAAVSRAASATCCNQIDSGPPALPADCPGDLVALVHRLLARDLTPRLTSAGEARDTLARWRETTRRTSPVGADAAVVPPLDVNPTRRTEAGIGHAPTGPISGAPHAAADPRRAAAGAGRMPAGRSRTFGLHAGGGSGGRRRRRPAVGGETRRTQPQVAVLDPPCPRCRGCVERSAADPGAVRTDVADRRRHGPTGPTGAVPSGARRRWRFGPLHRRRRPVVLIVWGTWKVGGEMRVWSESDLLGRKVHAAEPEALDEMVETYSSLSERSSLGWGTWPARQPLREALTLHVDRVHPRLPPARADGAPEPVAAGAGVGGQGARDRRRRIAAGPLPAVRRAREADRRRRRDPRPGPTAATAC